MKKALVLMMTLLMAVMMVAGCGGGDKKAPAVQAPKVLKVGTEPTFAPFEFQKEGSKEFDGFDMDLIRAIGKQLNRLRHGSDPRYRQAAEHESGNPEHGL